MITTEAQSIVQYNTNKCLEVKGKIHTQKNAQWQWDNLFAKSTPSKLSLFLRSISSAQSHSPLIVPYNLRCQASPSSPLLPSLSLCRFLLIVSSLCHSIYLPLHFCLCHFLHRFLFGPNLLSFSPTLPTHCQTNTGEHLTALVTSASNDLLVKSCLCSSEELFVHER